MAVISVTEDYRERSGGLTRTGKRYTRVFLVATNSANDGPGRVATAAGIPPIGTAYVEAGGFTDGSATVANIDPRLLDDGDRLNWRVIVTYETPSDEGVGGGGSTNENPLDDGPSWRWYTRTVSGEVTKCYAAMFGGNLRQGPSSGSQRDLMIANSAGEPMDPSPQSEFSVLVFEYTENVAAFDANAWIGYVDTINGDNFTVKGMDIEIFQARASINAASGLRNGVEFIQRTTILEIVDDWRLKYSDMGYVQSLEDADSDYPPNSHRVPILDAQGQPVQTPSALNGVGKPADGNAATLLFRVNRTATYANLGLPTT